MLKEIDRSNHHQHILRQLFYDMNIVVDMLYTTQGVPEISGHFRYAVTDFPFQVFQKGVLVTATFVDFKRETIPFRVLNLKNKPKIVDKGSVITTCEPVVDTFARPQIFPNHNMFCQFWRILKDLMKNRE
ncbi:hypothetical protein AVEN_91225-1 [Araneus ventricosus]|uniref:Uncharacterized protein n=1 Tax=Araneus ventricosus TaxID=182803 RepID=A0A4Y2S870_ARAVE|nr:hypothetical protein AVEN_91225-1 [Araneus ventricosus]